MQSSKVILRRLRGCRELFVSDAATNGSCNSPVISGQVIIRLFHATENCSSKSPSTPEATESTKDTTKRIKTPIGTDYLSSVNY